MHPLSLVAGLSAIGLSVAFKSQIGKTKSCSWNPLLREDQLTCAAPRPKSRPKTTHSVPQVEISRNANDKRYEPHQTYKLPASWKGPDHCFREFCLFSNPDAGDDGVVLITTSRNAYIAANSFIPKNTGLEPTAYYEAEVPGKGAGLFANRTIRKGEIILQRAPAVLIQATPHRELDPEVREELYTIAVNRLPEATKTRFLNQMGSTIYDKSEMNAFRMFVDGDHKHSAHLGIFPEVSKMNHDCRPNIHYRMANLTHTTVAVRDIAPGEELTVSYIFGKSARARRLTQLSEWGFACQCSQCTLPTSESGASDIRIRLIKELEDEMEKIMGRPGGKGVKPEMAGKLVELYLEERLDAYLAPTYTKAALIYSMFGNEARARVYAREAVGALERETGPHAKDIESMERLAENPKAHWSWAIKVTSGRPGVKAANVTRGSGKHGKKAS